MQKIFTLLLMFFCALAVNAQLQVDPTFNPTDNGGGKHNGVFGGESDVVQGLPLSNGKILVGGFYGVMHNKTNQGLSLLNADGSIDPSFKAPDINDDLGDGVSAMALQADGKILLSGYDIQVYHGKKVHNLVRINPDGTSDAGFNSGKGFNNPFGDVSNSIAIQADGKILIGGSFSNYDGTAVNALIRINHDGSLDKSFAFSSDSTTEINKVKILSNGKILIGGVFKIHADNSYKNLALLNADGSLDNSFNPNAQITINTVTALDVQQDNKIVFACDSSVYRVNTNGSIDAGFTKGKLVNDQNPDYNYYTTYTRDIKIQPDGKILLAGGFTSYNGIPKKNIIRLNTDGSIDNSFSTGTGFGSNSYGGQIDNRIISISLLADGRIFIAGDFLFYRGVWQGTMAVLNSDGSINTTFNADNGKGADANVNKIAVQPDKKILIAGFFSDYNGVNRNKIARLNVDGTLDNSFNAGSGPDSCNVLNTVVLEKDGKILTGGNFAHFNNALKSYIVRLNADGSLDNAFNFTAFAKKYGDVTDGVLAIAVQDDGKIIIGLQTIENYITGEYNYNAVLRLNADGSLDNSFSTTLFNNNYTTIYSILIQPDGKILVAGDFNIDINGNRKSNLIRLNTDGSFDKTFNSGGEGPDDAVYSVNLQSDGKIIISGNFYSYNDADAYILARLNTDGSLDASYTPVIPDVETDLSYSGFGISTVDADNKVLLSYLYYTDVPFGRVLRYNTDGSIDNTFGTENKADYLVSDLALQDKKLLLGGFIQSFNGVNRNRITRITTPEILPVTWLAVNATIKNTHDVEVTWQTAEELNMKNYTVQKSINGISFSNLTSVLPGKGSGSKKYVYTDVNGALAADKIYYRILETDNDGKIDYSRIVSVAAGNISVQLYPNPVQNVLHIKNLSADANKTISIINAEGKIAGNMKTSLNNYDINTSRLAPGVYYLKIISGADSYMYKFIKE